MSHLALPGRKSKGRIVRGLAIVAAGVLLALGLAFASTHVIGAVCYVPKLDRLFAELHRDPMLVTALRGQNTALADKDETWALEQDKAWNAERLNGGGPIQTALMQKEASAHLRDIVLASDGLIGHAFLIDAKGRMAAAPFLSHNFWQFNKPKFHYTFPKGVNARDVSWLQLSWEGSHPVCWRAETMADPTTGAPIGVLALEVNYLKVGYFGCMEEPAHTDAERKTNRVSSE
jgi:hypothetical protein